MFSVPLVDPPPAAAPPTGMRVTWPVVPLPESSEVELSPCESRSLEPSRFELSPVGLPGPELGPSLLPPSRSPLPKPPLGLGNGK